MNHMLNPKIPKRPEEIPVLPKDPVAKPGLFPELPIIPEEEEPIDPEEEPFEEPPFEVPPPGEGP
jgi:hypothetical protein